MVWTRRTYLAWASAATLGACAHVPDASGPERLLDTDSGRVLDPASLRARVLASDVVLLGELHDNPHHHEARAGLLARLPGPVTVVAEHLPQGARFLLPAGAPTEELLRALEHAGFETGGWGWPLHAPLFAAVARGGHGLQGGNLAREQVRAIAREGIGALPAELRALAENAPLSPSARRVLERDLVRGHCGHLGASRLPGMVWAQRGRDMAMALALSQAWDAVRAGTGQGPVVLVAGNGHVRKDYGVPQVLAAMRPGARVMSIGFGENGNPDFDGSSAVFDVVWSTQPAQRTDPCEAFRVTRPKAG